MSIEYNVDKSLKYSTRRSIFITSEKLSQKQRRIGVSFIRDNIGNISEGQWQAGWFAGYKTKKVEGTSYGVLIYSAPDTPEIDLTRKIDKGYGYEGIQDTSYGVVGYNKPNSNYINLSAPYIIDFHANSSHGFLKSQLSLEDILPILKSLNNIFNKLNRLKHQQLA